MIRPTRWRALAAAALLFACAGVSAETLFATSVRTFASGGRDKVVGSLYAINLGDATAKLVAPIRLRGESAVGITGLAVQPGSGTVYAITSPLSPVSPHSLVTLDVNTGHAELIGPMGADGSDAAFDPDGKLYVWLPATSQVGLVDLATAAVEPLGSPGPPGNGGGIAIDRSGTAFVTPGGASGHLDKVDTRTGAITRGPLLHGAPFPTGISAMTFSPSGLLLAINSNGGSPANVRLVTINTATGQVSAIGSLPDDTDALAFASGRSSGVASLLATMSGRTMSLLALVVVLAIAAGAVALAKSLRR
ncbi:MAG TPA: hypothetical protein VEG27_02535 [Usitatibacter sp.]|nr:hypothetical protein [Usitatibacter sp.]